MIRSAPNAVGIEHVGDTVSEVVPPTNANYANCKLRSGGATPYHQSWQSSDSGAYYDDVMTRYHATFRASPNAYPVIIRAKILEGSNPPLSLIQGADQSWIFVTNSTPDTSAGGGNSNDNDFISYTQNALGGNHTQGYRETAKSSAGDQSPVSWNYWRVLMELDLGVSYLATYGDDIQSGATNAGYTEAFQIGNDYAGFRDKPFTSPGAWVALRGGTRSPVGNYEFFMKRLDPSGTSVAIDRENVFDIVGDDAQPYGRFARKNRSDTDGKLYFQLDSDFKNNLPTGTATCSLSIWYLDDTGTTFSVAYGDQLPVVGPRRTGTNKRLRWSPPTMACSKLAGSHTYATPTSAAQIWDIRVDGSPTSPVTLHRIEVRVGSR